MLMIVLVTAATGALLDVRFRVLELRATFLLIGSFSVGATLGNDPWNIHFYFFGNRTGGQLHC